MTRLAILLAATALGSAQALAGYTIYEDKALPSVLFVEFDTTDRVAPARNAGSRPASGPAVIGVDGAATTTSASGDQSSGGDGGDGNGGDGGDGGDNAADGNEGGEQRDRFAETMDNALDIKDEDFRDFVVQEQIRSQIIND